MTGSRLRISIGCALIGGPAVLLLKLLKTAGLLALAWAFAAGQIFISVVELLEDDA